MTLHIWSLKSPSVSHVWDCDSPGFMGMVLIVDKFQISPRVGVLHVWTFDVYYVLHDLGDMMLLLPLTPCTSKMFLVVHEVLSSSSGCIFSLAMPGNSNSCTQ